MKRFDFEKKVITIQPEDKKWLDNKAKELGMTTNQLIRNILKDYIKKGK